MDLGPWRGEYKSPNAGTMEDFAVLTALPLWLSAIGLGVLGAIFGSFIATLVVRWPAGRSVMRGRSACDGCGRALGPIELVPLVSGLVARGRCRTCAAPIDRVHGRVEALAALVGASAGMLLPVEQALAAAVFGWLLLALGALDARDFWLPDELTLALALGGLATGWLGVAPPLSDRLIGGVSGFAALSAVGAAYQLLRGRAGLGGGDPKLLGAIGLWLGWRLLPAVLLLAALIGLAVAGLRRLRGVEVRLGDAMPLGTLLAIAAYPAEIAMLGYRP